MRSSFVFLKIWTEYNAHSPSLHCTIICNGIQVGMPTKPNETQPNKVQAFLSKGYKRATSRSADTASDQLASSGQSYTDQKLTASPNLPSGASTPTSASSNEPAAWKAPFRKAFESHFGMRDLFAIKIDPEDFASLGSSLQHFTRECVSKSSLSFLKYISTAEQHARQPRSRGCA